MAYQNINTCRSFNQTVNTGLSVLVNQPCSEVTIYNRGYSILEIYDNGYTSASNALILSGGENVSVRGITNSNQVSAKFASGSGTIYYRTAFFTYSTVNYG
jgi:hypothetical protein